MQVPEDHGDPGSAPAPTEQPADGRAEPGALAATVQAPPQGWRTAGAMQDSAASSQTTLLCRCKESGAAWIRRRVPGGHAEGQCPRLPPSVECPRHRGKRDLIV